MRFKRGDKVVSTKDSFVGIVTNIKERGTAGSDVTFIEKLTVTLENGLIVTGYPSEFKLVEDA